MHQPFDPVYLSQNYFAACHEATTRVAASALRIATHLDQWQKDHWSYGPSNYADQTRLSQWLLKENFIQEGFGNEKLGNRIETGFFLWGQMKIMDQLMEIHRIDVATFNPPPPTAAEFQNCAAEVLQVYREGEAACLGFETAFPHSIRSEFALEVIRQAAELPSRMAIRAIHRTEADICFLRGPTASPFTP